MEFTDLNDYLENYKGGALDPSLETYIRENPKDAARSLKIFMQNFLAADPEPKREAFLAYKYKGYAAIGLAGLTKTGFLFPFGLDMIFRISALFAEDMYRDKFPVYVFVDALKNLYAPAHKEVLVSYINNENNTDYVQTVAAQLLGQLAGSNLISKEEAEEIFAPHLTPEAFAINPYSYIAVLTYAAEGNLKELVNKAKVLVSPRQIAKSLGSADGLEKRMEKAGSQTAELTLKDFNDYLESAKSVDDGITAYFDALRQKYPEAIDESVYLSNSLMFSEWARMNTPSAKSKPLKPAAAKNTAAKKKKKKKKKK